MPSAHVLGCFNKCICLCHSPEVTTTLELQPSNMFMEDVGTVQACVMIAPSNVTETSLTVDLRSLDGTASEKIFLEIKGSCIDLITHSYTLQQILMITVIVIHSKLHLLVAPRVLLLNVLIYQLWMTTLLRGNIASPLK